MKAGRPVRRRGGVVNQTREGGGMAQGSGSGGDGNGQKMVQPTVFVDRLDVGCKGNKNPG